MIVHYDCRAGPRITHDFSDDRDALKLSCSENSVNHGVDYHLLTFIVWDCSLFSEMFFLLQLMGQKVFWHSKCGSTCIHSQTTYRTGLTGAATRQEANNRDTYTGESFLLSVQVFPWITTHSLNTFGLLIVLIFILRRRHQITRAIPSLIVIIQHFDLIINLIGCFLPLSVYLFLYPFAFPKL